MDPQSDKSRTLRLDQGLVYIEDNLTEAEMGGGLTVIIHDGSTDVATREGFHITAEKREEQAQWSYSRRTFSTATPVYLALLYPDTWRQEMENPHPSKQTRQLVGLIEIATGVLGLARQMGKSVRLLIEQPETHLHPAMQAKVTDVLVAILKDYAPQPPSQTPA